MRQLGKYNSSEMRINVGERVSMPVNHFGGGFLQNEGGEDPCKRRLGSTFSSSNVTGSRSPQIGGGSPAPFEQHLSVSGKTGHMAVASRTQETRLEHKGDPTVTETLEESQTGEACQIGG